MLTGSTEQQKDTEKAVTVNINCKNKFFNFLKDLNYG